MTSAAPQDAGRLAVRVSAIDEQADRVRSFRLEPADGSALPPWEPGAHIDVHLPTGLVRQYSLCGDPAERDAYVIAVLRTPDSRGGSRYLHDTLGGGDTLTIGAPRNNFPFQARGRRLLFIAGGIGITPILPMVQQAEREGESWSLFYGGRSADSMAYARYLARFGDRVRIVPEDSAGRLDLDEILGRPRTDTEVYCCGPEGMLKAVRERCDRWPPGHHHEERFTASRSAQGAATAHTFRVVARHTGVEVTVHSDESIADALTAAGVPVMTSCREGLCGTCQTTVIDGTPDHRDDILGQAERASGTTMVLCVSRCRGDRLVLDI
ncbi:PDR/VanB family oxidoreductase [Streptomyces scabiei]|uniref:PDR/VanB family oxidoreductase n=1 Tax=Streptomyces scabiei TaxID=1930 RepID=UPI0036CF1967